MRLLPAICLVSTLLSSGCAAKHAPFPEPLVGVDMANVSKGDASPFSGVLLSPAYFQNYLQWKCKEEGKC